MMDAFGNINKLSDEVRDASRAAWLDTWAQDVRIALRMLRRSLPSTTIALASIALSIGAVSIVFAAVKAVLLNPLPFRAPGELVQLRSDNLLAGPSHSDWLFWHDAQEIARRTQTLESVGVYGNAVLDVGGDATTPPLALYGAWISANLFPLLGVKPMIGRNITVQEDRPGQPNEVLLSYGTWSTRFRGDSKIVGRKIRVNAQECLVIGVMPRGFNFPLQREANRKPTPYVAFWAPMRMDPASRSAREGGLQAVARLRTGFTLSEAQQDLARISRDLGKEFPAQNRDRALRLGFLEDRTIGNVRQALWVLLAAAVSFLLIGCANVANLLLARGAARRRELTIRMAVGAGRGRIVRQLLTESSVLALAGGLCGYALTAGAWMVLAAIAPTSIPRLGDTRADWGVLAFSLTVALGNGLLFGIAPALRAAASGTRGALSSRGAALLRQDRTRAGLVIAEVAIAVALVVTGGKLLGSFVGLLETYPGFNARHVLAAVVLPPPDRYPTQEARAAVYRRFLEAVRQIPGVQKAGTVDALPFSGENHGGFISTGKGDQSVAEVDKIGGDYLQALGVKLEKGRWFGEEELTRASDTALINEEVAHRLWPHREALGMRMCVDCTPEKPNNWKQVIGIVSSLQHADLAAKSGGSVYLSTNALAEAAFLVVRTDRPMKEVDLAVRKAVASVDPEQAVLLSASMHDFVWDSIAARRFITSLLTGVGALALLMSLAGIYGVTAYLAGRRTQEIGIRMAVGATPANIHALMFRQGFASVAAGLAVGAILAFLLVHGLRGLLPGMESGMSTGIWVAAVLVLLTAALACWLPSWRAAKTDPMTALRAE